jgi:alkylation response protein AidB-like acyl-CoA dehydrogenase
LTRQEPERRADTSASWADRSEALRSRFAAIFARIQASALRHEHERSLPYDEVRWLAEAGFGALRLPAAEGGGGASVAEFFALLTDLAAADSNQPQIWRNHIAFVEDRLQPQPAGQNQYWRKQVVSGAVIGGAWSERGTSSHRDLATELSHPGGAWVLNGVKYYSTGSNFADWISVAAKRDDDAAGVIAMVGARAPGVTVEDDWTGFGQRTTGSGTSRFTAVPVEDAGIFAFSERAPYQEAVYQLVHVTTLAGIARAAHRDAVAHLRQRARAYGHGLSEVPREDAQLQAVVGRVGALAASAEASVARAARYLDVAAAAATCGRDEATVTRAVHEAAVAVYEAQLTTTDEALTAATVLFDALGSSALDISLALDRHWRNARAIASHNPRVYKERLVGAWHLNGTPPVVYGGEKPAAGGAVSPGEL